MVSLISPAVTYSLTWCVVFVKDQQILLLNTPL